MGALKEHSNYTMKTSTIDSPHDCHEIYVLRLMRLMSIFITITPLNPRGGMDTLTSNSVQFAKDDSYTCGAGHKVIYWGKEEKRGRLKFLCPAPGGKYECLVRATCSRSQYVRTFYLNPNQDYRLMRLFPRGTALW